MTYPSATNRYLEYTYDPAGKVIRKRQFDNKVLQKNTDYIDGFIYTTAGAGTPQLNYFGMPEGRVRNTGGATVTLKQEFIITDHQGNARISFEDNGSGVAAVKQKNSYYAFGLSMTSTMTLPAAPNKNLYNGGSEWQNDFADQPDWQQTFYRNYDQATGRFLAVDPMAEGADEMTVYQYAGNNPVMMNDPMGNLQMYGGRPQLKQDYSHRVGDYGDLDAYQQYVYNTYGGGSTTPKFWNNIESIANKFWDKYNLSDSEAQINFDLGDVSNNNGYYLRWNTARSISKYNGLSSEITEHSKFVSISTNPLDWVHLDSRDVKVTFDPGANQLVSPKLGLFFRAVMNLAHWELGVNSINISSTTNHPTNAAKSRHSKGLAFDINYINGIHVTNNENSPIYNIEFDFFDIIQKAQNAFNDQYLEFYGPTNQMRWTNQGNTYWPSVAPEHQNHIHISLQ